MKKEMLYCFSVARGAKQFVAPLFVLLVWAGCTRNADQEHKESRELVAIQFSTGLEDNKVIVPDHAGRVAFLTADFPGSAQGTAYDMGLFFTRDDGTTPYEQGSINMRGELLSKTPEPSYTWRYQYDSSSEWFPNLRAYVGETVALWAYYPRRSAGVSLTSGPFDLSTVTEQNSQTDVLYCPKQVVTLISSNAIPMVFRHFYAMFEFQVKKSGSSGATFTRVEVSNKQGVNVIKNRGTFNPQNGAIVDGATAGTIAVNYASGNVLQPNSYTSFYVMIPPFSDIFSDGDIEVQFYDSGVSKPRKFLIKREYLTDKGLGVYALQGGGRYVFKLLYSSFGEFTLLGWDNGGTTSGDIGTLPPTVMEYGVAPNGLIKGGVIFGAKTLGTYNSYYGEGTVTNGSMSALADIYKNEPPYYKLEIAKVDIYDRTTTWTQYRDVATVAGDICKKKMGSDWRMPRLSELMMMALNRAAFTNKADGFVAFVNDQQYWSASEASVTNVYNVQMNVSNNIFSSVKGMMGNYVRCVREVAL